ncbi:hypothetical protein ACLOJK_038089 [Asimina triloba]
MTASSMQTSIVGASWQCATLLSSCHQCAADVPTCCWRAGGGDRAVAIDGGSARSIDDEAAEETVDAVMGEDGRDGSWESVA